MDIGNIHAALLLHIEPMSYINWGVWKICAKTNAEIGLKIYTHWILINNEKLL